PRESSERRFFMPDATQAAPIQMRAEVLRAEGDGGNVFRFRASSATQARDGLTIPAAAWDTEHFLRNPVVLLQHGFGGAGSMPIGHVTELVRDDMGLVATVNFDPDD